ncbi:MAG: potassium channel family protein [Gammaproteobacteria bacterium]|nr:potassium channel family protein [Gammaproteobacteria bacterium]
MDDLINHFRERSNGNRYTGTDHQKGALSRIMKNAIKLLSQRILIFLVEDVSLLVYGLIFIIIVIGFGIVYTYLTPVGHGIGQNLMPLSETTLLEGIYFSVVTVSSLGYGDMHPVGISKALAGLEVLLGLAVIGIMVAKVTSQRLSYHVSRLFSSDAQKRLESIATEIDNAANKFKEITREYGSYYQSTPNEKSTLNGAPSISEFRELYRKDIDEFKRNCVELHDYFSYEVAQGNYFQSVPASAIVRVGDSLDDAFFVLSQFIISLSPQTRGTILDRLNRQSISEAIDSQKKLCGIVCQHTTDEDTKAVFRRIDETCQQVPVSYFAVPDISQPDQILQDTNEPENLPS